jgi:TolA-binding protein
MKKIITLLVLSLAIQTQNVYGIVGDSTNIKSMKPFAWKPISGVSKILQFEKEVKKRTIQQVDLAKENYDAAIKFMNNKEYSSAITEFQAAMKKYKRAKLSPDAYNYIRVNMALCYANTGNKEDLSLATRNTTILTPVIFKEDNWAYNVAILYHILGNDSEATNILSSLIRNNQFNFQSYITLEAIYKNSGNQNDANRVRSRMQTAEAKMLAKNNKQKNDPTVKKEKKVFQPKGVKPDILNLKIITNDDLLQYNKVEDIAERNMEQVKKGISEYNSGVNELKNKNYTSAQKKLKEAEKRLKRGKINDDGLNFSRGNLAIAYLSKGDKRSIGQSKRYLKNITAKLYKSKAWTYNLAVAHYVFSSNSRGTTKGVYLKKAIRLFRIVIKTDKLFLPAHENLIYIYKELGEDGKALKAQKNYEKCRNELIKTFSRQEQLNKGMNDLYIFRIKLGTFGEYDTPAILFDQNELITVPINEEKTAYLAGKFYNLENAISYQKKMKNKGFTKAFIVAYKNGEETEF